MLFILPHIYDVALARLEGGTPYIGRNFLFFFFLINLRLISIAIDFYRLLVYVLTTPDGILPAPAWHKQTTDKKEITNLNSSLLTRGLF